MSTDCLFSMYRKLLGAMPSCGFEGSWRKRFPGPHGGCWRMAGFSTAGCSCAEERDMAVESPAEGQLCVPPGDRAPLSKETPGERERDTAQDSRQACQGEPWGSQGCPKTSVWCQKCNCQWNPNPPQDPAARRVSMRESLKSSWVTRGSLVFLELTQFFGSIQSHFNPCPGRWGVVWSRSKESWRSIWEKYSEKHSIQCNLPKRFVTFTLQSADTPTLCEGRYNLRWMKGSSWCKSTFVSSFLLPWVHAFSS